MNKTIIASLITVGVSISGLPAQSHADVPNVVAHVWGVEKYPDHNTDCIFVKLEDVNYPGTRFEVVVGPVGHMPTNATEDEFNNAVFGLQFALGLSDVATNPFRFYFTGRTIPECKSMATGLPLKEILPYVGTR